MILNIIVILLEVLYYSLFLKYAKKEDNLLRYIITFTIISIIGVFIGTSNVLSYIALLFMIVLGLKYIARVKVKNYDLLVIFVMLVFKILIEGLCFLLIYRFMNNFWFTMVIDAVKIGLVLLLRNKITALYNKVEQKWNNNNFYIRYIFNIFLFIFIIMSFVFIIIK